MLAFAGIVVAVMQTLLVPVIKDLPQLLDTAPANATWVLTSTLLSGAVATPIMGRLGDLYGKRRMLILSLAVMVVGALVSALTSDLLTMIAGRTLQGFAMGAIPLGIGLMRDMLPREKLGSAMALMSSSIGVGGGLALPLAALIAQHADWHALFYGAAGIGALAIVLTLLVVPESPARAEGTFDVLGAIGLSAGLVLFLLPITKGSDWGWSSGTTLGLFAASAVVLLLWGVMELRVKAPWSTCAPPPARRSSSPTWRRSWWASRSTSSPSSFPSCSSSRRRPATASASRWSSRACWSLRWA